jgi:hypothetical protein
MFNFRTIFKYIIVNEAKAIILLVLVCKAIQKQSYVLSAKIDIVHFQLSFYKRNALNASLRSIKELWKLIFPPVSSSE